MAVLEDPASPEHSELVAILMDLAQRDPTQTLAPARYVASTRAL
jgi:hypothetical protein